MLERHHNERFMALMYQHLPKWPEYRRTLNKAPLAYDRWGYSAHLRNQKLSDLTLCYQFGKADDGAVHNTGGTDAKHYFA